MATIAEQLTSLANTKTAIKQAIINKGVQVADDTPFSGYATKIGEISGGGAATKFGASVDTFVGDAVNGVLQKTTAQTALNFSGITEIGYSALSYAFYGRAGITSVDLSSVQTIGDYGLEFAFSKSSGITSIDLSSLQSVGSRGLESAFFNCSGITGVFDLSSLQSVDFFGMSGAFYNCTGITSIDLSSLQSVGQSAFMNAFFNCSDLTTISFPSLTSVQTSSFGSTTFNNCKNLTEIHFRADMQATIEAMTAYANKFGATNATIYFDL